MDVYAFMIDNYSGMFSIIIMYLSSHPIHCVDVITVTEKKLFLQDYNMYIKQNYGGIIMANNFD